MKKRDTNKTFRTHSLSSEEYDTEDGRMLRRCEELIPVNKCEGTCFSQVQPSVATVSGFLKECNCCRESQLQERSVVLSKCFDPDGIPLKGEDGRMQLDIKEPTDCKCFKCNEIL
ncbi:unnamed protein product [Darwinula stevensoni]|uniref:Partner of bursicon n=1 Tax=Darwinula stevensoni TaxID=69355 RepID=A0A7R9FSI5_9CRUS|nr:unnamed protein product [Darwinula stevensoni]CAG0902728.1 unnamed protein product [Darwinula stevensoni]